MGETITAFWAEYGNVLMEGIGDTLLMTGIPRYLPIFSACPWGWH